MRLVRGGDPAVLQEMDLLRRGGDLRIVRDDEYRALLRLVKVAEQRADRLGRLRVEIARRLVRKNDVRLGKKRARDRDALLLAAGELLGPLAEDSLDSERGDEGGETGFVGLRAVEAERKDDVVANRPLVEEVERLEHYADVAAPELRRLRVAHLHDVPPADENLARVRGKEPRREMEESGLSAPARTHQRLEPTLLDCEGEVLENLLHAISAAYAARLQSLHVSSDFCF